MTIRFGIRWFHERRMALVSPVVAIQFFQRYVIWFDTSPRAPSSSRDGQRSTEHGANHSTDRHHHGPDAPVVVQGREQPDGRTEHDERDEDEFSHVCRVQATKRTRAAAFCNCCGVDAVSQAERATRNDSRRRVGPSLVRANRSRTRGPTSDEKSRQRLALLFEFLRVRSLQMTEVVQLPTYARQFIGMGYPQQRPVRFVVNQ